MSNLIQNPNFGNWKHVRYLTDQENKTTTIETAEHWDFVYVPRESDPHKIPQSLHRDNGFVMSAGYRKWEAGYKQGNLNLKAGTRYQLKARIKADVNFPGGQAPDRSAITWRFTVESDKGKLEQDWAMTSQQQTKQTEDFFYIFDVEEDITAAITFWGRSFYAGNDCDFWMYEVTLTPVEKTNAQVDSLGAKGVDVTETEKIAKSFVDDAMTTKIDATTSTTEGASLASITLTAEEIDLIASALRTLGVQSNNQGISDGLSLLAAKFESLK